MTKWQLFHDVVQLLAVVVGVAIAWRGLQTWRDQLAGSTEYELARRVLRAVYQLREAIAHVRAPFVAVEEWADRPNRNHERRDSRDERAADLWFAYYKRWQRIVPAHSELEVALLEAEVLWGSELKEAREKLFQPLRRLSIELFHRYLRRDSGGIWEHLSPEERGKTERVIWAGALDQSGGDSFADEVAQAVALFESALRKHLPQRRARGERGFLRRINKW